MAILIFWLPAFLMAMVPGCMVGWVIGQCRISKEKAGMICVILAVLVAAACDQFNKWGPPGIDRTFESLSLLSPPIALALWIGVLMGRPKVSSEAASLEHPSPLDPRNWRR